MSKHNGRPFLVLADRDLGREAWAQYNAEAEIFTLAASEDMDDPIGEAESVRSSSSAAKVCARPSAALAAASSQASGPALGLFKLSSITPRHSSLCMPASSSGLACSAMKSANLPAPAGVKSWIC